MRMMKIRGTKAAKNAIHIALGKDGIKRLKENATKNSLYEYGDTPSICCTRRPLAVDINIFYNNILIGLKKHLVELSTVSEQSADKFPFMVDGDIYIKLKGENSDNKKIKIF